MQTQMQHLLCRRISDEAAEAAANQPLVDIITTSFGPIGGVPVLALKMQQESPSLKNTNSHGGF